MSSGELLVIRRGYDFCKWLLQHTGKFPKSHRFSVAVKLENAILEFIELAAVANTRRDKRPLLRQADEALTRLRLLFRLSYEMRFINSRFSLIQRRNYIHGITRSKGSWKISV